MPDSANSQAPAGEGQLHVIPQPRKVSRDPGTLGVGSSDPIFATAPEIAPLAHVLAEEIFLVTGLQLGTGSGASTESDIVLRIDEGMKGEAHSLVVYETITAASGGYAGISAATATLLQLLDGRDGSLTIPRVQIEDKPAYSYLGLPSDWARKYHTLGGIEQLIELCVRTGDWVAHSKTRVASVGFFKTAERRA